jgi:hypothetical protein
MDCTLFRTIEQHWLAWRETLATEGSDLTAVDFACTLVSMFQATPVLIKGLNSAPLRE